MIKLTLGKHLGFLSLALSGFTSYLQNILAIVCKFSDVPYLVYNARVVKYNYNMLIRLETDFKLYFSI